MKTVLILITSLFIVGVIISPFFWIRFSSKRRKILFLSVCSLLSLLLAIFFQFWLYDFILDNYIHTYDALSYFDGISTNALYIFIALILFSPFIFTKILYQQFTIKRIIISLLLSILILTALVLIFAYVIFPMVGSALLNNV